MLTLVQQWHEEHKARLIRLGQIDPVRRYVPRSMVEPAPRLKPQAKSRQVKEPEVRPPLVLAKVLPSETPSMFRIKTVVGYHYRIPVDVLNSPSRNKAVVWARQVAIYLILTLIKVSLNRAAKSFGKRDHTTALHAKRVVERALLTDENLQATIKQLTSQIQGESCGVATVV